MSKLIEWVGISVLAIGLIVVLALLYSVPVYFLWNWVMPDLFGMQEVTWMQALGLMMLCGFLFKNSSSSDSK